MFQAVKGVNTEQGVCDTGENPEPPEDGVRWRRCFLAIALAADGLSLHGALTVGRGAPLAPSEQKRINQG